MGPRGPFRRTGENGRPIVARARPNGLCAGPGRGPPEGLRDPPKPGRKERRGPGRVERDVARTALPGRGHAANTVRISPVPRPQEPPELVAGDGFGGGEVQWAARVEPGELEQGRGELGHVCRAADLVGEELDAVLQREP